MSGSTACARDNDNLLLSTVTHMTETFAGVLISDTTGKGLSACHRRQKQKMQDGSSLEDTAGHWERKQSREDCNDVASAAGAGTKGSGEQFSRGSLKSGF